MSYTIVSKTERGHWRCGRFWQAGRTDVDQLSPEQLKALHADPRIVVLEPRDSADQAIAAAAAERSAAKTEAEHQASERAKGERQRQGERR